MKTRALIAVALMGLSAALAGAADAPTPARAQMAGFIAAFNSGDRAKIEAFGRDHAPPDFVRPQVLDDTMRMFAETGGLDVLEVRDSGPLALTSTVRGRRTGDIGQLRIAVDPAAPERITDIQLLDAESAAQQ